MIVLGLTGSIAMGKSTLSGFFRSEGINVYDADKTVHKLMQAGGKAVSSIEAIFPQVITDGGGVDRQSLSQIVFNNKEYLSQLEGILHPLVQEDRKYWLEEKSQNNEIWCVVLDIPLLFETGGEQYCDRVVVASCSYFLQEKRALRRHGMSKERFIAILNAQIPAEKKRQLADFIVPTDYGKTVSKWYIREMLKMLKIMHKLNNDKK